MPDTRPLAPILDGHMLDGHMTERDLAAIGDVLHEWAGVGLHQATVDDLHEARFHQQLYLDFLERERVRRLAAAGVVDLTAYREGRL